MLLNKEIQEIEEFRGVDLDEPIDMDEFYSTGIYKMMTSDSNEDQEMELEKNVLGEKGTFETLEVERRSADEKEEKKDI